MSKSHILLALLIIIGSSNTYSQTEPQVSSPIESSSADQAEKTIRFYRANKHQQRLRLSIPKKKANVAGCHNFKRGRRVATTVQFGYNTCSIYAEKDCLSESIITANHSKQDAYAEKLTQGHGWQPKQETKKDKKGVKTRSWYCE